MLIIVYCNSDIDVKRLVNWGIEGQLTHFEVWSSYIDYSGPHSDWYKS
jgi:hypothetical protein